MKKTLFGRIVIFGIAVALLLLVAITSVMVYVYHSLTIQNYDQKAAECAEAIEETFHEYKMGLEEFGSLPVAQSKFREYITQHCEYYDFSFVYIYRPGDVKGTRKYYFSVAQNKEDDDIIATVKDYGTVINSPLGSIEQDVFNGTIPYGVAYTNREFGRVYTWFFPIVDNSKKISAVIAMDYSADAFYSKVISSSLYALIPSFIMLCAILVFVFWKMKSNIIIPLRQISSKMDTYDPSVDLDLSGIKKIGEIETISDSFEEMSDSIKKYISDISTLSEERAVASAELNIARKIQMGMVPEHMSITDNRVDIKAYCHPAREVGGDFYSCSQKDRYVYLVIGDVSGKGVAAAMFMAMTLSLVREKLHSGTTPASALNSVNNALCSENPEGMFVTVFAAVYDSFTGEMAYANAGHTKPVLITSEASFLEPDPGIALGLFDDSDIVDGILMLEPGDGIIVYTDGVTEAVGPDNEFYGESRILSCINPGKRSDNTSALADNISSFAGGNSQFDDITIMALFRTNPVSASFSKLLPPEIEAFDEVKDALISILGMNSDTRKIILACEEIFANIVNYSGTANVRVICALENNVTVVRFEDSGTEFDPLTSDIPKKDFDELDSGGMGIMLVRQIAADISYSRIDGKNILTLEFNGSSRNTQE